VTDQPDGVSVAASEHEDEGRYDAGDRHRRRSAHLLGLIVSGAVLAAAPESYRIVRVILVLVGTLAVYWVAETYVHWIASRTIHGRDLTPEERRHIVRDGWPLMAACVVPLSVLLVEALLDVPTVLAVNIALGINTALLFIVGWNMGRAGALRGWQLVFASAVTGLLGVAMILLKSGLH
jgi:hypothetical protein